MDFSWTDTQIEIGCFAEAELNDALVDSVSNRIVGVKLCFEVAKSNIQRNTIARLLGL